MNWGKQWTDFSAVATGDLGMKGVESLGLARCRGGRW